MAVILEASRQLFEELGYARATTNRIAERAGVSIGTLYQYFPNKGALLHTLGEEHHREVHGVVADAVTRLADPATDLAQGLRSMLEGLVGLHETRPGLHRILAEEVESGLAGRKRAEEAEHFSRIVAALLRARPEVEVRDPDLAARLVVHTVEAVARWLGHEAPEELDRQAAIAELVVMLNGYLRSGPP